MSAKTKFSLPNTTEVPRRKLNTIILSVKFTLLQHVVNFCCTWLKLSETDEGADCENLVANLKALCVYIYVCVCVYIHS